jgi:hypothetical protein
MRTRKPTRDPEATDLERRQKIFDLRADGTAAQVPRTRRQPETVRFSYCLRRPL